MVAQTGRARGCRGVRVTATATVCFEYLLTRPGWPAARCFFSHTACHNVRLPCKCLPGRNCVPRAGSLECARGWVMNATHHTHCTCALGLMLLVFAMHARPGKEGGQGRSVTNVACVRIARAACFGSGVGDSDAYAVFGAALRAAAFLWTGHWPVPCTNGKMCTLMC